MNLTLKYFGLLVDITQKKEEVLHLDQNKVALSDVKSAIETLYGELKNANYTIAVNQLMCTLESTINDGDVIALLPPFAGG
jgi:sulfur-carrier protein